MIKRSRGFLIWFKEIRLIFKVYDHFSRTKTEIGNCQPWKTRENLYEKDPVVDKDIINFVGSIVLRHITQLICNASAIYEGMT